MATALYGLAEPSHSSIARLVCCRAADSSVFSLTTISFQEWRAFCFPGKYARGDWPPGDEHIVWDQGLRFMLTMTNLLAKFLSGAIALLLLVGCAGQAVAPQAVVEVQSEVVEPAKPVEVDFCDPEQGAPFSYRKKVAVLATELLQPQDAGDLPGLTARWSELLQQRLNESGRLLVVNASDQHLHSGPLQQEWIVALANRLDVQFVVAVRFHNLHTSRNQFGVGRYTIPSLRMRRQVDAELMIFDGLYGTQIASVFYATQAEGSESEVINLARSPLLRGAFITTPLGEALNSVLNAEVEQGLKKLACLPLMARVTKVVGDSLYISTSGAALIRPGDILQLFRLSGQIESRLGAVEVIKVFPESAVAVYKGEGGAPKYSEGLRVRAW